MTPVNPRPRRALLPAPVVALGLGLAACGGGGSTATPAASPGTTVATDATTTAPPTTAAPTTTPDVAPTTTAPPAPAAPTAADTAALQERLVQLGYFQSDDAGVAGPGLRNAVMAFQKLNGLERDGVAGPATMAALASAAPVQPRAGAGPHLEVDLAAQVAIVVASDGTVTALNATSGKPSTPTPAGTYSIFRQVDGWDPGPYGSLYRPKYFTGGVAFHGGVPVLAEAASHGCVRLPDPAVDWLWSSGVALRGTQVVVY